MSPLRVLSLFSGVGAFEFALERLGVGFEIVRYCEIDRFAARAYAMLHGVAESLNIGDVERCDVAALAPLLPNLDLVCWAFPCTDLCEGGSRKGFFSVDAASGECVRTRSGLFFAGLEIVRATLPRLSVIENAETLASPLYRSELETVLRELSALGYASTVEVLDARDFGVPQSRRRTFIVSRRDGDSAPRIASRRGLAACDINEALAQGTSPYLCSGDVAAKFYLAEDTSTDTVASSIERVPALVSVEKKTRVVRARACAHTVMASASKGIGSQRTSAVLDARRRLRRLTPAEHCRLMGFPARATDLLVANFSDTQVYRMAGNSIVVPVLESIFTDLFL
jgi:DNA (cytosine-5)-methyltransferase 1